MFNSGDITITAANVIDLAGNTIGGTDSATDSGHAQGTLPTVTGLSDDATVTTAKTWTWDCDETCSYRFAVDTSPTWTPVGVFGATATATQSTGSGTYYLHVQAKDAAGNLSDPVTTVSAVLNHAPTLTMPDNRVFPVDGAHSPLIQANSSVYTLTTTISDPDGDSTTSTCAVESVGLDASDLGYVASGTDCSALPSYTLTNGILVLGTAGYSSGTLTWDPTVRQHGTYKFTISASDGTDSASGSFYASVREPFTTVNMSAAFDALFSSETSGLSGIAAIPRLAAGINNGLTSWFGMIGSALGSLTGFSSAGPWVGTGAPGSSLGLSFDAAHSDHLSISGMPSGATQLTVTGWMKANVNIDTHRILLSNDDGAGGGFTFMQSYKENYLDLYVGSQLPYFETVMKDYPRVYYRMSNVNGSQGESSTSISLANVSGTSDHAVDGDTARYFNGTNSSAQTASSFFGSALTDATLEFFFMASALPGSGFVSLAEEGNTTSATGQNLLVRLDSDGALVYGIYNGGLNTQTTAPLSDPTDTWHHVVLTYSSTGHHNTDGDNFLQLYVDGSLLSSYASPVAPPQTTNKLILGRKAGAITGYFKGDLDEVAFYLFEMTPAQVAAHYAARTASPTCLMSNSTAFTDSSPVPFQIQVGTSISYSVYSTGNTLNCSVTPTLAYAASSAPLQIGGGAADTASSGTLNQLFVYSTSDGSSPISAADLTSNYLAAANRYRSTPIEPRTQSGLLYELDPANSAMEFGIGGPSISSQYRLANDSSSLAVGSPSGTSGSGIPADPYVGRFNLNGMHFAFGSVSTNSGTIEAWVKYSGTQISLDSTVYGPISSITDNDVPTANRLRLGLNGSDPASAVLLWVPNEAGESLSGTHPIGTGWRHVVVTYDGATQALYLDGALEATVDISAPENVTNNLLMGTIQNNYYDGNGDYQTDNASFSGDLGPMRVYTRALTPTEIKQNCWAQKDRFSGASCAGP